MNLKSIDKIFSILVITLLFTNTSSASIKKKSGIKIAPNTQVTVIGAFTKYDSKSIYLKVKGANQLIKIPKKYSLNHPENYSKGLLLKMELPLNEYMALNLKKTNNKNKKKIN